jgi:hypothetical protein
MPFAVEGGRGVKSAEMALGATQCARVQRRVVAQLESVTLAPQLYPLPNRQTSHLRWPGVLSTHAGPVLPRNGNWKRCLIQVQPDPGPDTGNRGIRCKPTDFRDWIHFYWQWKAWDFSFMRRLSNSVAKASSQLFVLWLLNLRIRCWHCLGHVALTTTPNISDV